LACFKDLRKAVKVCGWDINTKNASCGGNGLNILI